MKKVVLLSGHYYNSKRQAGFHFLANSFDKLGFEVTFITSVVSLFTYMRKDYRIYENGFTSNLFITKKYHNIKSVINFSLIHPINRKSKLIYFLINILYKLSKVSINEIRNSDYVVFESVPSILFFETIKLINPKAKLIYRMSDDMEIIKFPKQVIDYERKILNKFDLISVPTKLMYDKFNILSSKNVRLHFHGIDKVQYDQEKISPYSEKINHIFVGNSHLDESFIDIASTLFKDHFFHIIGPFEPKIQKNNVIYYGQMPFKETIRYVKFASTGLQIRSNEGGTAETLADSLKVLQYSYCKLPILAPSTVPAFHRKNFFYYEYDDLRSIKESIDGALNFNKSDFVEHFQNWDELAYLLIND